MGTWAGKCEICVLLKFLIFSFVQFAILHGRI